MSSHQTGAGSLRPFWTRPQPWRRGLVEVREHAVERTRNAVEVECLDEERRVPDLPVPHEPPELLLAREVALRGLLLKGAEGRELALVRDHRLDALRADCAHELVLEVGDAHEEAEPLQLGSRERLSRGRRARARGGARDSSPSSQRPARRASAPCGPKRSRKRPTAWMPPVASTTTPSATRSRPLRLASVSSATLSLVPSTRTTARASVPSGRACTLLGLSGPGRMRARLVVVGEPVVGHVLPRRRVGDELPRARADPRIAVDRTEPDAVVVVAPDHAAEERRAAQAAEDLLAAALGRPRRGARSRPARSAPFPARREPSRRRRSPCGAGSACSGSTRRRRTASTPRTAPRRTRTRP